uniref:Uncharacterized protein n=1 Tax=Anguilla anguilla TaxID=7936 RepID=A0A0E9T0P0_ANGAN
MAGLDLASFFLLLMTSRQCFLCLTSHFCKLKNETCFC